jgi:hypothetical protein
MIPFERQSSLLCRGDPGEFRFVSMVSWTRALKPLVGSPATSWVAALLDFVGHARQMFADRPQRRFRF